MLRTSLIALAAVLGATMSTGAFAAGGGSHVKVFSGNRGMHQPAPRTPAVISAPQAGTYKHIPQAKIHARKAGRDQNDY
jgi:hypothetical protein